MNRHVIASTFFFGGYVLLILGITFFLTNAESSISDLVKEYLEKNVEIKKTRVDQELLYLARRQAENALPFNIGLKGERTDSQLYNRIFGRIQTNKYTETGLEISKEFITGSTIAVSAGLVDFTESSLTSYSKSYTQQISFYQDIGRNLFGRAERLNRKFARDSESLGELLGNSNRENLVVSFAANYLEAAELKEKISLKEEAIQRSLKREEFVKSQVNIGLKEKADLLSVQTSTLAHHEEHELAKESFQVVLTELSKMMSRMLNFNEVQLISAVDLTQISPGDVRLNSQFRYLQNKSKNSAMKIDLSQNNVFPDLSIFAKYATNNYADSTSRAFNDGTVGSENREIAVGVSVNWPIGEKIARDEVIKDKVQNRFDQYREQDYLRKLQLTQKEVEQRIEINSKNIEFGRRRLELARMTLKEVNRLYERGKVGLEQLIRAEEDLISTEEGLLRYIHKKWLLAMDQGLLSGELDKVLKIEK